MACGGLMVYSGLVAGAGLRVCGGLMAYDKLMVYSRLVAGA